MALSQGQIEDVLRRAGIDLGRVGDYRNRQDLTGTQGQDILFKELTGQQGNWFSNEQAAKQKAESDAFAAQQAAKVDEFRGRLQDIPTSLEAVRQEMGIPEAFQTFGELGEQARGVANVVRDLPQSVQQALAGQGVSAGQIAGRQSAELQALQPTIESVTRGLEAGGAGLQNLLQEFSSRTQATFAPFEIEAGVLGDQIAQEFSLFKTNIQANLDRELAYLSRQTELDLADIEKAIRLAEAEQAASEGVFRDLGDRIALINPFTGDEITSFTKGLSPTRGSSGSGGNISADTDEALSTIDSEQGTNEQRSVRIIG